MQEGKIMRKKEMKKYTAALKTAFAAADGETRGLLVLLHDHLLMGTLDFVSDKKRDLDKWDTYLQRLLALRDGSRSEAGYAAYSAAIASAKEVKPELDRWN
jgi:hypothetical protein